MRKILIAISFVLLFCSIIVDPSTSFACSCMQPPSPEEELKRKTAVFSGKVIEIVDTESKSLLQSSADPIRVVFEVDRTWKGIDQTQAIVYTARDSASCGFNFSLNEEYIVYAYGEVGSLKTGICDRTNSIDNAAEDLEALGEGSKPGTVVDLLEKSNHNYLVYGGTLFILCLLIIVILRRKYKK